MNELTIELIKLMAPAVWILPTAYLLFYFLRRRDYERFDMERRIKIEELDQQRYFEHKKTREFDKEDRYNPKLQEELLFRLHKLEDILSTLHVEPQDKDLSLRLDSILSAVTQSQEKPSGSAEQLIRELSHSLNTPLSQIEVSASIALSTIDGQDELAKSIRSILDSVEVCKAFLGAFRELVISGSAAVWNPKSIEVAVVSASKVYADSINKKITLEVDLPETIEGYSNNYITALVLPILENAIESNKQGMGVTVNFLQEGDKNQILVINEPQNEPGDDEIYEQGFTTKEDHEGTGLTSVRHLLSAYRGASLEHNFKTQLATFTITFPRRVE
jgi:signal transduction histidine kinase